ncbi:hypothetical protein BGZ95_005725, partial [Linnemannia exigua]
YHYHHHRGKQQQYDARQPPLPWSFSDDHHHGENGISGGMAVGVSSPSSPLYHSASSGSRKSVSSSSTSSLSPTLHYHQDPTHCQLLPSTFQSQDCTVTKNRTKAPSAAVPPGNFQEGHPNPHILHVGPGIQDRRKSLSILQNLSQASQKFRTMIRSPTATAGIGMRRRTVMNMSPITMDPDATASVTSMTSGGGTGVGDIVMILQEGQVEEDGEREALSGEIDVAPFVSDKDMEEIFGSDQQKLQLLQQQGDDDSTTTSV